MSSTLATTSAVPDVDLLQFTPSREITPESATWAAANLADLPIVYTFHPERPVRQEADTTGTVFRLAFAIVASPSEKRHFNVHLHSGASSDDLKKAHRLIQEAKAGLFNGDMWRLREDGNWICRKWWEVRDGDHCNELRECHESGCVKLWHEWVGGEQFLGCELEGIDTGDYLVTGYRYDGKWAAGASMRADVPEGPAGLRMIQDLANDYAWMQAECDRLNNAPHAVSAA
ncbi:hypothetical protein [Leucobacter massiliensis]|uniref:Uncharacterized protein n=1 Tax=Leucobacter massiliensis TaxID=1686285 RepID=A0A2S9QNA5_9MICO|nr:hypothetical protein [Leucobacter massiliensis]PRI11073.1 hypothetical protein B4915_09430 [Leucobacter massiliensis]